MIKLKVDYYVVYNIFFEFFLIFAALSKIIHNKKNFNFSLVSPIFYIYLIIAIYLVFMGNLYKLKDFAADLFLNFFRLLILFSLVCPQFADYPIRQVTFNDGYAYLLGLTLLKIYILVVKYFDKKTNNASICILVPIYIFYVTLISYYINTKADFINAIILILIVTNLILLKKYKTIYVYNCFYLYPLLAILYQLAYFANFLDAMLPLNK